MRIRTILAAAAAPAALAGVLLGTAGQASAATVPNPKSVITMTNDHVGYAEFAKSIDVPAGVRFQLDGGVIHGNVTVEGTLVLGGVTVDGNVTVSDNGIARTPGTGAELVLQNNASHITGNLTVTGSVGGENGNTPRNGTAYFTNASQPWGPVPVTQIDGNFTFTNNPGWLYVGAPMHVNGHFTASANGPYGNSAGWTPDGVSADGGTSVQPPVITG
jgi:hypothetical protein